MKKFIALLFFALGCLPTLAVNSTEIELPEIGDSAGSLISPQQEYRIGQSFYWRLQQSVDLIEDPEVTRYLSELGARLVSNSDAPNVSFKFFMVPDPTVNAFAAPGGFIGINSGLLVTSQQEDELASVMAHEIAHVTQRHLLRSFEKSKNLSLPRTAALIGAALLGVADPKLGAAAVTAVQAGRVQSQINFTRAHEAEADNLGMLTLVRSGFDAQAMPTFFERLQQANQFHTGRSVPEFLRTHPVTTSRIAESRGRAVNYPVKRQLNDDLQFYLMREKLRGMTSTNLTQLIKYYESALQSGNSVRQVATQYGYSLALSSRGSYSQAKSILQSLIDQDEDRLSYQLALADVEMVSGRLSSALEIYRKNQRLFPDDHALSVKQATALLQAKKAGAATDLLLRQLQMGHSSRRVYKLLAQARGDLGDTSQAHSWLAEYYFKAGRLEQAADQLRLAAKAARGNQYRLAKINSRLRDVESTLTQLEEL